MGGSRTTGTFDDGPGEGESEDLDARLRAFTDQQRAGDHASRRRAEATLRQQAQAEGTMAGVLIDLAERGVPLAIATLGGRTLRGTVHTLGQDYVGLRATGGEEVVVAMTALATVRTEPGATQTVGDRISRPTATLQTTLASLTEQRPLVSVLSVGSDGVAGRLWQVGQDVLTIRADAGVMTYVPLAMVSDIVLA